MAVTQKTAIGIPTIDVTLATIVTGDSTTGEEIMLDTATKIEVETQVETTDPNKLIIKNILRSQVPGSNVVTGTSITFTDNVFTPELVKVLQGGTITYSSTDPKKIIKYVPPVTGSNETGEPFVLNIYTSVYSPAGKIVNYEKTSYPNCQGMPITMNSEDGVFRVNEYTINSYPDTGQAPYEIEWVDTLPVLPKTFMAMNTPTEHEARSFKANTVSEEKVTDEILESNLLEENELKQLGTNELLSGNHLAINEDKSLMK